MQQALATAGTLTIGTFTNATRYFAIYPEDIKMLGFSFNTALLRTGTLFSGEISRHLDFPVQLPVEEVLATTLSPVLLSTVEAYHDLKECSYLATGLDNERNMYRFSEGADPRDFSPNALLYYIR